MSIRILIASLALALALQPSAVALAEQSVLALADEETQCGSPLTSAQEHEVVPLQSREPSTDAGEQSLFFDNVLPLPSIPIPFSAAAQKLAGFVDRLHGEISLRLLTSATWLDSFFADERSAEEQNRTYVRFRYDVFRERRASTTYQPAVDLRLALPQLERKAHIVISADPADTAKNAASPSPVATAATTDRIAPPQARNVTTALYYYFLNTVENSIVVRTGALFSHGKPVLFISPRYRWLTPLNSWDFRFTQDTIWRTDNGWQADTRFDLEEELPYALFFRASLGGTWIEQKNGYFYNTGCSLRQPLDSKRALEYEWLSSFQTSPVGELTEVMFRVRYRQGFWREWMFFELAPQYRLPRDRQFNGTPGILFRLEMFFGSKA